MTLLNKKRFLPLFLTQFLGAFNDNMLRNALVVLVTFKVSASQIPFDANIITVVASGLLVLPYIIFSSIAGELADKFERSKLVIYTKVFELVIMLAAVYAFWTSNVNLLLGLLFAAGMQATFFSPMKYSILPDHLHKQELMKGNGFIESGTFLAILIGSIAGTGLGSVIDTQNQNTTLYVGIALVLISLIGLVASLYIPIAKPAHPNLKLSRSITFGSWRILRAVFADKTILKAVLFTSWFWLCGSVFLALFPGYVKNNLAATEGLYAIFLATFSVGIAAGAVACSKILKNDITPKLTAKTLVGVTVFTLLMVLLSTPSANKILLCITMFCTAFCWGIYTVPLKTIIQAHAKDENRSRIIAGENILNAAFMVAAMIINVFLLQSGTDILTIFVIIAILNLIVAIIAKKIW